jgi:hypothetical protein
MTEAEAIKKWCPLAASRVVTFPNGETVMFGDKPSVCCIASRCGWWQRIWDGGPDHGGGRCGAVREP